MPIFLEVWWSSCGCMMHGISTNAVEVPVKFEFRKMGDEEAQEIVRWRYNPPYDFYDSVSDPDDLTELLDSR